MHPSAPKYLDHDLGESGIYLLRRVQKWFDIGTPFWDLRAKKNCCQTRMTTSSARPHGAARALLPACCAAFRLQYFQDERTGCKELLLDKARGNEMATRTGVAARCAIALLLDLSLIHI